MKNTNKKGFTLVELLVVIAIVAILATVAIVGYTSFTNKAHESNDRTLVAQLNTAVLRGDGQKYTNPYDAFKAVDEAGFDVAKIKATAEKHEILWDNKNGEFFYTADDNRTEDVWIVDDEINKTYSTYYIGAINGGTLSLEDAVNFAVYTEGNAVVNIYAPNAEIKHYGEAKEINLLAVAPSSYYENGKVEKISISAGRVVVDKNAVVASVVVEETTQEVKVELAAGSKTSTVVVKDAEAKVEIATGANYDVIAPGTETAQSAMGTIVTGSGKDAEKVIVDTVVTAPEAGEFAGGLGTEKYPFLIETVEHLQNITNHYDSYSYYKVIAKELDCKNWIPVYLNGNFDGNNATFTNLEGALFNTVSGELNNFNVQVSSNYVHQSHKAAVVNNVYDSITFNNVNVSGTMIGYSIASYVGICYADGENELKVTFNNCVSSLNLIGFGEYATGFIGYSNLGAAYNGKSPIALELNESYFIGTLISQANYYYSWGNNAGWFSSFADNSTEKDNYVKNTWNGSSKQAIGGTYILDNGSKVMFINNGDSSGIAVGDTLSVDAKVGSTVALAAMIVAPNDSNGKGSYTGVYHTETLNPVDGKYTTEDIKKFNIHINDATHSSTGIDGNDFYINHSMNGTTYNAYMVIFVEFSDATMTNCIGVTSYNLK